MGIFSGIPKVNTACIYCITNATNGKQYVGSTKNARSRIMAHFNLLREGNHHCKDMQEDFNKGDRFVADLVEAFEGHASSNQLLTAEHNWIARLDTLNRGYNEQTPCIHEAPPPMEIKINTRQLSKYAKQFDGCWTVRKRSKLRKLCEILGCDMEEIVKFIS